MGDRSGVRKNITDRNQTENENQIKLNFYRDHCSGLILYCSRIRKNIENSEQTENRHTDNSITEATLIPVDRQGERANIRCVMLDLSH